MSKYEHAIMECPHHGQQIHFRRFGGKEWTCPHCPLPRPGSDKEEIIRFINPDEWKLRRW